MPPYGSVPQNATLSTARFGPFEIDLRTGELRKLGIKLKLSGQPFQILAILVERRAVDDREERFGANHELRPDYGASRGIEYRYRLLAADVVRAAEHERDRC